MTLTPRTRYCRHSGDVSLSLSETKPPETQGTSTNNKCFRRRVTTQSLLKDLSDPLAGPVVSHEWTEERGGFSRPGRGLPPSTPLPFRVHRVRNSNERSGMVVTQRQEPDTSFVSLNSRIFRPGKVPLSSPTPTHTFWV